MEDNTIEIHVEINPHCHLKCLHCSSIATSKSNFKLNIDNLVKFIQSFDKTKIIIILTGGEPLNLGDSELKNIISKLQSVSNISKIGIFTSGCYMNNGKLTHLDDTKISWLKKLEVDFYTISVYSHIESIHDEITGVEGSLCCTLTSINNLVRNGVIVNVNYVLMQSNNKLVDDTIPFLFKLGITELRILRLVKHGRAINNWDFIGIEKDKQRNIVNHIFSKYANIYPISFGGFPFIKGCQFFRDDNKCHAGINKFYIDIKGDIYPCGCKKNDKTFNFGDITSLTSSNFRLKQVPISDCLLDIE